MSSFNDKIDQVYVVLAATNARHHASTKAIAQLNTDILAVNEKIGQLSEQVAELILAHQSEQEDLKQMARQYAEWRKQVQAMQADVTLILQHLNQELGNTADDGEMR